MRLQTVQLRPTDPRPRFNLGLIFIGSAASPCYALGAPSEKEGNRAPQAAAGITRKLSPSMQEPTLNRSLTDAGLLTVWFSLQRES